MAGFCNRLLPSIAGSSDDAEIALNLVFLTYHAYSLQRGQIVIFFLVRPLGQFDLLVRNLQSGSQQQKTWCTVADREIAETPIASRSGPGAGHPYRLADRLCL